ncbi:MFS transporter [Pseudomonas aeruginosa]
MPSTVSSSRLGLAGLCILLAGQLLPMIDFSIVNVALDALAHSLGASETELELIVAVYGVAFAVCLAMGGRLGDNYGRRRLFDLGVALFAVASLLCGLAGSVWLLLVARALQGVGAALVVPQILATLHVSLSGHAHSRALAAYGAIGGLAFVVGQVLGGFLVSADIGGLGWRSVFLINLPICLGILLCSRRWVPETRAEHAARVDAPGTLLLAALILCLLLPLALGPSLHWSWPCALLLAAAVPLLAWLWRTELRQERRQAWPLLPPSLLRLPSIRFGLLLAILFFACWSGFMFALALALQAGAGLSPVQAGNAFIVLGASYFVSALLTARVAARIGPVRLLLLGCVIQMCGLLGLMLTLQRVWPQPGILNLAPATLVIGFGQAFIVSSFFRIGLSEVPAAQAGGRRPHHAPRPPPPPPPRRARARRGGGGPPPHPPPRPRAPGPPRPAPGPRAPRHPRPAPGRARPPPPGAGSAMLATVQQASLGLGSALLGAVFAHRLERHGDYLEATQTTLAVEFVLMTLLLGATCLFYLRRVRTVPLRCDSPGN